MTFRFASSSRAPEARKPEPRRARPLAARVATASLLAVGVVITASCGSRTGLFGETDETTLPDGAIRRDSDVLPDAPTDGPVACTPGKFTFEVAVSQLMFVIDRSGSMRFSLDGQRPNSITDQLPPGVQSRWEVLRDALFQTITPFDNSLAMGAKFFPEVVEDGADVTAACATDVGVAIAPARGNSGQIIGVFDTSVPRGGTPTAEAVRLGAQFLSGTRGVVRSMVLATDGAPNCNGALDQDTCTCTATRANGTPACNGVDGEYNCLDDRRSIDAVRTIAETQKIPVYVIGIGSTERPEFLKVLDDMAVAGGRARPTAPRHYNVQTAAEMKSALQTIQEAVGKCTFLTPSAPTDPSAISVEVNGVSIPRDTTHTNGWDWVDQAYGTLTFFGPACNLASAGETPQITGVVRCDN